MKQKNFTIEDVGCAYQVWDWEPYDRYGESAEVVFEGNEDECDSYIENYGKN